MRLSFKRIGAAVLALGILPGIAVAGSKNHHSFKIPQYFAPHKHKFQKVDSLADAAKRSHRLVGSAASYNLLTSDEVYAEILTSEFNYITPENAGKWGPLQPNSPDEWNFDAHDEMVAFAGENHLAYKGHALVWHSQAPSFINDDLTADELQGLIDQHVNTTVTRYSKEIRAWDVVNEAMGDDAQYRDSVFYRKLGPDFIANAFYAAKSADPTATLYYNDYNIAGMNAKSDAVYNMLKDLKDAGVPVDGIGFQMHLTAASAPSYDELVANFRRFAWLGLRVNVSELDVRISDLPWDYQTNLAIQRQVYHRVVSACMAVRRCESVTTWGINDQYSWINYTFGPDAPLPWDENYGRKPAYYGMLDGFMRLAPDASDLPNLVDNSNFEGGVAGWSAWAGEIQHVRSFGRHRSNVLLLSERSENWSAAAYDLTDKVIPGQTYDVSASTKLTWKSPADTVELNTKVVCEGGEAQYNNLEVSVADARRWVELSGVLEVPACELSEVTVFVGGPQSGVSLLLDEVVVRPQVLVPSSDGYGDNLVSNPYFETGTEGWFGFGAAVVGISNDTVKSGAQSAYVSGRSDTWQGPATSVAEGVIAGDIYDMFAWVRVEGAASWVGATVKVSCADGDQFLGITGANLEADTWTLLRGSVQLPDCYLSDAVLYVEGPDAGVNLLLDEVYFRRDNAASDALDQVDDGNLHPNGGFELGTESWSSWGGTLGTSSDLIHSGAASGVLANRTANWQGPVFNLLSVAVPGGEYEISAWSMVQGASQDTLSITVKTVCEGEPESYNQLDAQLVDSVAWTRLSGSIVLPSCNLTEASLYFAGPEAGVDVYLDDVVILGSGVEAQNLIANPGFETGTEGWQSWGGNLQAVADEAHSGAQSGLLSARTGDWEGPVYPITDIVGPSGSYAISAWIKIAGATTAMTSITLKTTCEDGTEYYNWGGEVEVNDTGWTELAGNVPVPPDCVTVSAVLYFGGPAQEVDIYIDDVVATIAHPGDSVEGNSNLVTNSGFEGSLDGWVSWGGNLALSTDLVYAGDYSAVLSNRTGDWEGPVYSLLGAVDAGGSYAISAFTRISGSSAGTEPVSITVKVACDDGSSEYLWGGQVSAVDSDWTELAGSVTLPSCNLTEVSMYFGGAAQAASIYLDEVSVTAQ